MKEQYILSSIGFGGMAGHHCTQLKKCNTKIRIKGAYDADKSRQEAAAERGLYVYSSREELISDPEVDIVLIAVPNHLHKDFSIEALRSGKHVICEKPVTVSSEELLEIMAVAKETGRIFTIDQNRRTNKDFVLMRRKVEEGLIGEPYVFESRVEGSRGLPEGWRERKSQGGGMMLDWGVHLIDQMMYMLDEKVTNVFCKMYSVHYPEVDDNFRLTMTFESGKTAHIEVSTNNFITHPRWYVLGTDGTLQIDDWNCNGQIIRVKEKQNSWAQEIVMTKAGPTKTMAPRDKSTIETIALSEPLDVTDNLDPVYDQLVAAIEGAELKITSEQALRVMKVMEAAFESAQKGVGVKTDI